MMTFEFLYPIDHFPRYFLQHIFFARSGQLPMRSAVSFAPGDQNRGFFRLEVDWNDLGTIQVPYLHKRYGLLFFPTSALLPTKQPMHLVRELVRGQVARMVDMLYAWEQRGMKVSQRIVRAIAQGRSQLGKLLLSDINDPDYDKKAIELFESLIVLNHHLLDHYSEQALKARQYQETQCPIFLGIGTKQLDTLHHFCAENPEFLHVFEAWNPTLTWRDIEPEEGHFRWEAIDRLIAIAKEEYLDLHLGPIVRWNWHSLPSWIQKEIDDPYTVRRALFRYADLLIRRYPQIRNWIVSSSISSELSPILVSKRIEWADSLARIIRQENPSASIFVGIDQPWGDSLRTAAEIPPLELGERLASNRFFDAFHLTFDIGLTNDSSLPRDSMALNQLLDRWSLLGKPFHVSFSVPSAPHADFPQWETLPISSNIWNMATQQEMVHRYFMAFLTHRSVSGIFWNRMEDLQLTDPTSLLSSLSEETVPQRTTLSSSEDTEKILWDAPSAKQTHPKLTPIATWDEGQNSMNPFHSSGLFTSDGAPKPAFFKLAALQRAYM